MKRVLYFTAEWCGPCKMMKPIIEKISHGYSNFYTINVDHDSINRDKYKVGSIPTFIQVDDSGNELRRLNGVQSLNTLEALLKQ